MNKIDKFEPNILGFLCNWCCYTAADSAGVARFQYPPNIRVIRIMCTGRLDPTFPLEAFSMGADGVFVGGCHLGECHYQTGNYHALISAGFVHVILEYIGIDKRRFLIEWASAAEGTRFVKLITDFTDQIKMLGPLGKSENISQEVLKKRLKNAINASRGRKLRTALLNAAKNIIKENNYSRETIYNIIKNKCYRTIERSNL